MIKQEYLKLQAEIKKQHGEPEWELNMPVNESARKLRELRSTWIKEQAQMENMEQFLHDFKEIDVPSVDPMSIPDQVVKDSWLTPFDSDQRAVVNQWLQNIRQDAEQIAISTGLTTKLVKATLRSEAFKLLRKHLELAYKQLAPLEAVIRLRQLSHSKDEKIALQANKLIVNDAGLYKGDSIDVTNIKPTEVVLDDATQERLRKLAKDYRASKSNEQV